MVVAYTATLNPIAFLAPKSFTCKTNGNIYFRIPQGDAGSPNFRVRRRGVQAEDRTFADLKKYRDHYWPDGIGAYEKDSTLKDPGFKSFDTVTGTPHRDDDLRLRIHLKSPAKGTAAPMPQELHNMYVEATGTEPADRGCYPSTGARLQVGVDGRKV
jgi:hypothetical protein